MVTFNHINFALGSSSSQSCLLNRALPCFGNLANILASLPCFGNLAHSVTRDAGQRQSTGPQHLLCFCLFVQNSSESTLVTYHNKQYVIAFASATVFTKGNLSANFFFNCSFMTFKGDRRYYVRPRENAANATAQARCTRLSTISPHIFQEMKTLWTPQLDTIRRQEPFSSRPAGEKRRRHLDAG